MLAYREQAATLVAPLAGKQPDEILDLLTAPPNPALGDIALPCFALAKQAGQNPKDLAARIADELGAAEPFSRVAAMGPYVNFTVDPARLTGEVIAQARDPEHAYGQTDEGKGRTVVIDYSAPNIAKPLAVHHVRSTLIGAALVRLYRLLGYTVEGVNHLGDWGTNFGQLMVSYKRREAQHPGRSVDIHDLLAMYVRFHQQAESEDELNEQAQGWFSRLEQGDPEAVRLWEMFREESLRSFQKLYDRFGISFEHYIGESFYNDKMQATIDRLRDKGLAEESEGALVVKLDEEGMPPCLLRKRDGSTLYATRDLAAAEYRWQRWHFHKCLYVVGNQQELHFRQVFRVLEKMGHDWARRCEHVKFGMLSFGPGVFEDEGAPSGRRVTGSTRRGRIVFLQEVLDRAVAKARQIILDNAREDDVRENADALAEWVGVGAVVFGELAQRRTKDAVFTWDKALNLQGDSGPYLQYTHARLCSVLRRFGEDLPSQVDCSPLGTPLEIEVAKALARWPDHLARAKAENEPSILSDYLLALAAEFNRFFTDKARHRIIGEDRALTLARLALVDAVRRVLATGLGLLGIHAPEKM